MGIWNTFRGGEGFIEEDIQALTHSVCSGCCDVVQSLMPRQIIYIRGH